MPSGEGYQGKLLTMEISSIESFLHYWTRIRGRTTRVVRAIPPDRIDWTYAEGKWTLADLVRHLAALERYMFVENFLGRPGAVTTGESRGRA